MALLKIEDLSKNYGGIAALDHISLEIEEGELVSMLGPSGCGKTTALRLIAGFEKPDSGHIYIDGVRINEVPVNKRNIGMVFQSYALFPHMSVKENISYGLEQRKLPKKEVEKRAKEAIELVQLTGHEHKMPKTLSGGQQQRVALARALSVRPRILLLDESLSALDKKLRVEMQSELKRILEASRITALFVTHDQEEALTLSDRIVVMKEGRIVQAGKPYEVYEKPRNCFVADFLGKANFFERDENGKKTIHCVRPEKITISGSIPSPPYLEGTVSFVTYAGNITTYNIDCDGKNLLAEEQNAPRRARHAAGDKVWVCWEKEHFLLMEDRVE